MRYRELAKRLKKLGCEEYRSTKSSHRVWLNPKNGNKAIVPYWGSKDLKPGTVRGVVRQLGISRTLFGRIK